MIKIIGVIVVVLIIAVGVVLIIAAAQPGTFRIERSIAVKAPAEKIYPVIADFHKWADWSPFDKMDPTMQKTYTGSLQGKGAIYSWVGKGMAGVGRMEITDVMPPNKIDIKLDFSKPMKTQNTVEYTITQSGDSARVTWAMTGKSPYVAKLIHLFVNMDAMVGKSFDEGLMKLKQIAEKT